METVSLERWETVLEAERSSIVVVDLWASWCITCIDRFPKMVELAERYAHRSVRFLTLNLDDPADQAGIDWAGEFLTDLGGRFDHYRLEENLTHAFERLDLLAIPVVLIYDGQGNERFRLTNDNPNEQFTEEDVELAIEALLAE